MDIIKNEERENDKEVLQNIENINLTEFGFTCNYNDHLITDEKWYGDSLEVRKECDHDFCILHYQLILKENPSTNQICPFGNKNFNLEILTKPYIIFNQLFNYFYDFKLELKKDSISYVDYFINLIHPNFNTNLDSFYNFVIQLDKPNSNFSLIFWILSILSCSTYTLLSYLLINTKDKIYDLIILVLNILALSFLILSRYFVKKNPNNLGIFKDNIFYLLESDNINYKSMICLLFYLTLFFSSFTLFIIVNFIKSNNNITINIYIFILPIIIYPIQRIIRPANKLDSLHLILETRISAACLDILDSASLYTLNKYKFEEYLSILLIITFIIWYLSILIRLYLSIFINFPYSFKKIWGCLGASKEFLDNLKSQDYFFKNHELARFYIGNRIKAILSFIKLLGNIFSLSVKLIAIIIIPQYFEKELISVISLGLINTFNLIGLVSEYQKITFFSEQIEEKLEKFNEKYFLKILFVKLSPRILNILIMALIILFNLMSIFCFQYLSFLVYSYYSFITLIIELVGLILLLKKELLFGFIYLIYILKITFLIIFYLDKTIPSNIYEKYSILFFIYGFLINHLKFDYYYNKRLPKNEFSKKNLIRQNLLWQPNEKILISDDDENSYFFIHFITRLTRVTDEYINDKFVYIFCFLEDYAKSIKPESITVFITTASYFLILYKLPIYLIIIISFFSFIQILFSLSLYSISFILMESLATTNLKGYKKLKSLISIVSILSNFLSLVIRTWLFISYDESNLIFITKHLYQILIDTIIIIDYFSIRTNYVSFSNELEQIEIAESTQINKFKDFVKFIYIRKFFNIFYFPTGYGFDGIKDPNINNYEFVFGSEKFNFYSDLNKITKNIIEKIINRE